MHVFCDPFDPADPYLSNRSESYNASSFLHFILSDGALDPCDLYILGVSDFPGKKAFRIKDSRIAEYLEVYTGLRKRGATIITSNLPFDEWTEVFGSERLTGAILDRLTHHVHILEMNGESFRLRQSRKAKG